MKQIKRIMTSIFMCILAMSLLLMDIPHSAIVIEAESVKSGTISEGVTWQYGSDGTLTISGNGSMPDYTTVNNYYTGITTDVPWGDYLSNITKVVVNGNVNNIGKCAFSDCTSIKQVVFSSSVKEIGESAFARCIGLNSISFPNTLVSIGDDAFRGCTGITNIIIPDSVTNIGSGAFQACTNLTDIRLGKNISSIKSCTFSSCTKLINIEMPQNITSIGTYAFSLCSSILELNIPISVNSISSEAFTSCSSLKKVTVNNDSLYFGQRVFDNCSSNFVLYGNSGSTSETYAEKNAHVFVAMNADNSSLKISSFSIDKESGQKMGTKINLSVKASGGTAPYKYSFYYKTSNGSEKIIQSYSNANNVDYTLVEAGSYVFGVRVQDDKNTIIEQEIADYRITGFSNFAGGNGTAENPYRISDISMFCEMANYNNAHFILITNLDLSDVPRIEEFKGIFDGNGNTVTVGLSAKNGLFNSVVEGSVVKNLVINIGANKTLPAKEYGAVAITNEGKIENCHVKGSINVNSSQTYYRLFGGIAAYNIESGIIEKCRDSISVNLNDIETNESFWWGGIAGNSISGKITECLIENDFNITVRPTTSGFQTRIGSIAGVFGYSNISECAVNTNVSIAHLSHESNRTFGYGVFAGDEYDTYNNGLSLASELNGIASCYIPNDFSLKVNFEYYGSGGGLNSKSEIYTKDNIKNVKTMSSDKIIQWYESLVDDYKPIEIKALDITSFKASGTTVGENVRLDAIITGGTGQYSITYSYLLNGIETVLSKDTILTYDLFTPTEEGIYDFIVSVKDSSGEVVTRKIERYLISKIDDEEDENHDVNINSFNEYIYRANHLTDATELEGPIMEKYINAETPSEILVRELQKNGFNYTADAWRDFTRTCDAVSDISNIIDYAVEEKDIYEAIILNSLESAAKYDIIDTINADAIKEKNELLQIIKDDLKVNYSIDIYDSTQNTNLTKEMRVRTKELAAEYYEEKNIPKAVGWLDKFEDVMGYLDTVEDFCEEVTSYVNIRNMDDSMKTVLKEMKKNCPSDNKALAAALDDCVKILDVSDSEFEKQMVEGGLKIVGREAVKAGVSKFWDKVVISKIETLCPRVVIIKAAYKSSKYLTNLVFNTDEITEKYYKMIAATEFDSLIRSTYASLKNTYMNGKNVENAKAYLSAIDVMFSAISSDCDSAYAYVDSVDSANLSKICQLLGCNSNASSLKTSIDNIKIENNNEHESVLTSWVNYLPEDFPEEYPHYTKLFEESIKRIKEYKVHCPVDVYVYDSTDKLVASVINNIPGSSELSVVVDGDDKTFYLPEGEQYSISYVGNGTGVMDIEISEYDEIGTAIRNVNFNNIPLSEGVKYSSNDNGKFLEDAQYNLANSENQNREADFDSYSQTEKSKHTITIEQGMIFNGETPAFVVEAYENQVLDISAYVPAGCELDRWEVSSGKIEIKDVNSVNTKIIVGSEDATIKAVLKSGNTGEDGFLAGDVDCNGAVNLDDAKIVLRLAVGIKPKNPVTEQGQNNSDYDKSGRVDLDDAKYTLKTAVGIKFTLPSTT